MDTQINLNFTISNVKGLRDKVEIKWRNIQNTSENDCLVEFNEYESVELYFQSDNENDFIEIETYKKEELIPLKTSETLEILSMEQENMIVPGYYPIQIKTNDKIYKRLYKINPSSISWNRLLGIRDYLEKKLEGLAYDLFEERKNKDRYNIKNMNVYKLYEYLSNKQNHLDSILNEIIRNPIEDLDKKYIKSYKNKQMDYKSQKWLSQKGIKFNSNIYQPNFTYQKHFFSTKNNKENIWLRNNISNMALKIDEIGIELISIKLLKQKKLDDLEQKKYRYNRKLTILENDISISDKSKIRMKNRIKLCKEKIENIKNDIIIMEKMLSKMDKIKYKFNYYQYETWISRIDNRFDISPTNKIFIDYRYRYIHELSERISGRSISDKSIVENSLSFKKTSLLYEYYIVALVIDILTELGFKWLSGWLADLNNINIYFGDLPSETVMNFENEDYRIELRYDYEISREINNESDFISINSINRRPDILLSLYQNDEIIDAMIIEVKCRKTRYIYSKNGDTAVMEQLKNYYNLNYYYQNKKSKDRFNRIISKVVVTYPKQNKKILYDKFMFNFEFIQILPEDMNKSPYGYEELKESIIDFLQ